MMGRGSTIGEMSILDQQSPVYISIYLERGGRCNIERAGSYVEREEREKN